MQLIWGAPEGNGVPLRDLSIWEQDLPWPRPKILQLPLQINPDIGPRRDEAAGQGDAAAC
jgi:hypothetical protein